MSLWTPCTTCGQPVAATDHDHGCPKESDMTEIKSNLTDGDSQPSTFVARQTVVLAVQYVGPESVWQIQQFLWPFSPLYKPQTGEGVYGEQALLLVPIFDRNKTIEYPSLGRQHANVPVPVGGWICKGEDGELAIMTDEQFQQQFMPTADHLRQVNEEIARKHGVDLSGDLSPLPSFEGATKGIHDSVLAEFESKKREITIMDPIMVPAPGDDLDPTGVVPGVPLPPPRAYAVDAGYYQPGEAFPIAPIPVAIAPTAGFAADEVVEALRRPVTINDADEVLSERKAHHPAEAHPPADDDKIHF